MANHSSLQIVAPVLGDTSVRPHAETGAIDQFHSSTKWGGALDAGLATRINSFLFSPVLRELVATDRKQYRGYASIALPAAELGPITLQQAIAGRRSIAGHGNPLPGPITLDDLSAVLKFSYGITGELVLAPPYPRQPLRAAPSAGALYPLEIYPVVMNVQGVTPGLYHYDVFGHALTQLRVEDTRNLMPGFDLQPGFLSQASVVFLVTAVVQRTASKYLDRGYRFLLNDSGALIQNFYLTASARGLRGCALGGFEDDAVANYLGIDSRTEIVTLGFVVGGHSQ